MFRDIVTMSEIRIGLIPDVTMGPLVPRLYDLLISTERLIFVGKKPSKDRNFATDAQFVSAYGIEGLDSLASRSGSISVANTRIVQLRLEILAKRGPEFGLISLRLRYVGADDKARNLQAMMNPTLDFIRSKVLKPEKSRMAEQFRYAQVEYAKTIKDMLSQALPVGVLQNAEWLI